MPNWIISIFMILFCFQSIATVVETESQNSHDQLHHQHEGEQFALEHGFNAELDLGDHEGHHLHLCHHHHGEHNPQGLFHCPGLIVQYNLSENLLAAHGFYLSQLSGPLLRPPIG